MIRLRINQPTPCGGAYTELFYLNDPIENKNLPAITVIIQEYDANGKMLKETVGQYANHMMM